MVQYIHTPYPSRSSLLSLRSQFYPPPSLPLEIATQQKQEAVDRVALYTHRGSCPHLVESTALLTAVILSDQAGDTNTSTLRAAYVAAFGRFVTGLLRCGKQYPGPPRTSRWQRQRWKLYRSQQLPSSRPENNNGNSLRQAGCCMTKRNGFPSPSGLCK